MKLIKDKILFEDLISQSQVTGPSFPGPKNSSVKMTLLDILSKVTGDDKQHPNYVPASKTPINGMEFLTSLVGDVYIAVSNLESSIRRAKSNPVLNDRQQAKKDLDIILAKIAAIKKAADSISLDISNFSIEKPGE